MKKSILFCIAFIAISFAVKAQETATITVQVKPLSKGGNVVFTLHNEASFLKSEPIKMILQKADTDSVMVTFKNVPKGSYAIICLHDKNENNAMDFSENGMPLEHYGMSNNPLSLGPPQFSDAKFEVLEKDLTFEIKF